MSWSREAERSTPEATSSSSLCTGRSSPGTTPRRTSTRCGRSRRPTARLGRSRLEPREDGDRRGCRAQRSRRGSPPAEPVGIRCRQKRMLSRRCVSMMGTGHGLSSAPPRCGLTRRVSHSAANPRSGWVVARPDRQDLVNASTRSIRQDFLTATAVRDLVQRSPSGKQRARGRRHEWERRTLGRRVEDSPMTWRRKRRPQTMRAGWNRREAHGAMRESRRPRGATSGRPSPSCSSRSCSSASSRRASPLRSS